MMDVQSLHGKRPVIFSDFDGTITERDVIVMIMERFAPPVWRDIVDNILKHRTVSIRDGVAQLFDLIPSRLKPDILEFVGQNVRLRPGFDRVLNVCQRHDIPFLVVSGGLDFFIEPVLAPYRDQLQIFCNGSDFSGERIKLTMPHLDESCAPCGQCACCKIAVMDRYPKDDFFRITVGDSLTDRAMSLASDWAFARHQLPAILDEAGAAYTTYDDFNDIANVLEPFLAHQLTEVARS
jgi:2-hydroxy-3-keto-5-methylthiopentenyl-1-phosphate phosphatase